MLVEHFYEHLQKIAENVEKKNEEKYKDALAYLQPAMDGYKALLSDLKGLEEDEDEKRIIRNKLSMLRDKATTYTMLKRWIRQVSYGIFITFISSCKIFFEN